MRTEGTLLAGRYRVVRHLGSGGMASVVLCDDERLGRAVAVKRLHADSPGEMEQRFAREARLGASLNHPNLVAIYDTAIDDEGVLIVMEYVEGESLSQALRRGPLEPRRAGRMASELGDALDHAHAHGVVHRDVKPGNVLLREDGADEARGPGHRHRGRPDPDHPQRHRARQRRVHGARAARRRPGRARRRTCTRWPRCASRRSPGGGRAPGAPRWRSRARSPPSLRPTCATTCRRRPRRPPTILRRGLARDPRERPASAGELGSELRRALERPAEPTVATRPIRTPVGRRRRSPPGAARAAAPRGGPWLAIALASAIVAVAAATVALLAAGGGGDGGRAPRAGAGTSEQRAQQPQADRPPPGRASPRRPSRPPRSRRPPPRAARS